MTGTEWFLLIVVVIGLPLLVAVVVTLWTLEMARQRNKKNRQQPTAPVKRQATRNKPVNADDDTSVSRET